MPNRDSISLDDGYDPAAYSPNDSRPVDRSAPFVAYADGDAEREAEAQAWARRSASGVVDAVEAEQAPARRIPANAPRPQDHLKARKAKKPKRDRARSAVEREARGVETAAVDYDGETYEIPADVLDWSLDATIAFEEGRAVTAMRTLLGPKQFRTLMSKGYTNREFQALFDLLAKAGGFETSGN
ncbi:hypothetical protein [Nocardia sp. A7]|uniref:hypothetical protein n=1 Tax=Nocardia sp. A7 TaxID=2789274 RepID=UPI00397E4D9A